MGHMVAHGIDSTWALMRVPLRALSDGSLWPVAQRGLEKIKARMKGIRPNRAHWMSRSIRGLMLTPHTLEIGREFLARRVTSLRCFHKAISRIYFEGSFMLMILGPRGELLRALFVA